MTASDAVKLTQRVIAAKAEKERKDKEAEEQQHRERMVQAATTDVEQCLDYCFRWIEASAMAGKYSASVNHGPRSPYRATTIGLVAGKLRESGFGVNCTEVYVKAHDDPSRDFNTTEAHWWDVITNINWGEDFSNKA